MTAYERPTDAASLLALVEAAEEAQQRAWDRGARDTSRLSRRIQSLRDAHAAAELREAQASQGS